MDVDFGAGVNDILRVTATDGLTLSNTVVNLFYAGTGQPFAEPGTYTLFTYQGTLDGDAALLSVGNPQDGASYAFANDTANRRVTLTITGTSGGIAAVWIHPEGGAWAVGANWDGGTAPNGAGLVPLFGLAITNHATIDTGAGYTVGGLTFNNAAYGYTLGGSGGLTFADAGDPSTVSVSAGAHTLNTALNAPDGLNVTTADDAQLALGPDATVAAALTLAQGTLELQGNATLDGAVDLADATMLRARATTNAAIGTLSGASSSVVALTGDAPALTSIRRRRTPVRLRRSNATLDKLGAGALHLSHPSPVRRKSVGRCRYARLARLRNARFGPGARIRRARDQRAGNERTHGVLLQRCAQHQCLLDTGRYGESLRRDGSGSGVPEQRIWRTV